MYIDSEKLLNVELKDGEYTLMYGWPKYNRGKSTRNTEKVRVKNGKIVKSDLLKAADIYRIKSGLLDDGYIEDVKVHKNDVIEYLTGS